MPTITINGKEYKPGDVLPKQVDWLKLDRFDAEKEPDEHQTAHNTRMALYGILGKDAMDIRNLKIGETFLLSINQEKGWFIACIRKEYDDYIMVWLKIKCLQRLTVPA